MPAIFEKIDKIKPLYDIVYKITLIICKLLLIADIAITSMAVCGRYIPFIPDPAWSEQVVLTLMSSDDCFGFLSAQGADSFSRYTCRSCRFDAGFDHDCGGMAVCGKDRRAGFL